MEADELFVFSAIDLSSLWKSQVLKPHCIFPGTAESHRILVHVTFGDKDMGPPLSLLTEASCGLTCTHTTTYAHTQLTDTVRYRHVNTATQLSAQRWLASPTHPQGLGWCCVDTVTFTQPQSSLLGHVAESRAGLGRWVERLYHSDTVRSGAGTGGRA